MADEPTHELFEFESDFVATLRCVPMAVRFKLDRVRIKLTLRQWSKLDRKDRDELLQLPCRSESEVVGFRRRLAQMIQLRSGEALRELAAEADDTLSVSSTVPLQVRAFAVGRNLTPPTDRQWDSLSELRRFALLKLSRENHDNVNFEPAMREFGLTAAH